MTGPGILVRDAATGALLYTEVVAQPVVVADLIERLEAVVNGGWKGTSIADLCRQAAEVIEELQFQRNDIAADFMRCRCFVANDFEQWNNAREVQEERASLLHIMDRTEVVVLKLPVWLGKDTAALVVVTEYADGRLTLAVDGAA